MKRYSKWMAASGGALIIMGIIAGCGSPSGEGASPSVKKVTSSLSQSDSNAKPNTTIPSTNTSTSTSTSTLSTSTPFVTLENIQFTDNAFTLVLTHGTMQTTYADPHFSTGTPKQFIVTLRNTSPGKYSLNTEQPINTNWAKTMQITKNGDDLILKFDLKQGLSSFQIGVGGGFEIQFSFK